MHIIANWTSLGGKVYDTTFVSNRAARVAEELSHKYGLTIAKEVATVRPHRKAQADSARERTKQQIRNICYALLDKYRGKGLSGHSMFLYELHRIGVTIERMKNKQEVYGLKFTYGDHSFKASEIGRDFGYRTLPKQFETGNAQRPIISSSHSSTRSTKDRTPIVQVTGSVVDTALDKPSFGGRRGHNPTDAWRRLRRDLMATALKKPSREKEAAREGDMMFDVHPLHPSRPSPSQKLNRENRIKNACLSNSHSNIAPSNDKRPLFVQIPAIPSASLVSTSLPIQCLQPSNFFFCRGIFLNSFLGRLHHARAPAISCSHASFFLLARQLLLAHAPATSCSRASYFLLTRQLLLAHAPATSCSRASYILLARQLLLAHAPASSC